MRDALDAGTATSFRPPMATESLFSCVATRTSGTNENSEAGPKGGGQDELARSKRKVTQKRRPPHLALSTHEWVESS